MGLRSRMHQKLEFGPLPKTAARVVEITFQFEWDQPTLIPSQICGFLKRLSQNHGNHNAKSWSHFLMECWSIFAADQWTSHTTLVVALQTIDKNRGIGFEVMFGSLFAADQWTFYTNVVVSLQTIDKHTPSHQNRHKIGTAVISTSALRITLAQ